MREPLKIRTQAEAEGCGGTYYKLSTTEHHLECDGYFLDTCINLSINIVEGVVEAIIWQVRQGNIVAAWVPYFCGPRGITIIATGHQ